MDIELDPDRINEGMLSIYDGSDSHSGRFMAEYEIMNGTLPQSITSWTHQLVVKFSWTKAVHCEVLSYCIKFTILVDAGPSEYIDLLYNSSGHSYIPLPADQPVFPYRFITHED